MRLSLNILRKKSFYILLAEFLLILFILRGVLFIAHKENRLMISSYYSRKCRNYVQPLYSRKLNDRLVDYSAEARRGGIEECRGEADIIRNINERNLVRIRSNGTYLVDDLTHSYPYLTRDSKKLLSEIGKRYREKIGKVGLKGSKFIITSMTRTTENKKLLKKNNGNLSDNSPHVHGNAFDISYARFEFLKLFVTECDKWYLKEALGEVLWELRKEKRCWVTYERAQGCFHVVTRESKEKIISRSIP